MYKYEEIHVANYPILNLKTIIVFTFFLIFYIADKI